jgi:hypothetical protein
MVPPTRQRVAEKALAGRSADHPEHQSQGPRTTTVGIQEVVPAAADLGYLVEAGEVAPFGGIETVTALWYFSGHKNITLATLSFHVNA